MSKSTKEIIDILDTALYSSSTDKLLFNIIIETPRSSYTAYDLIEFLFKQMEDNLK